jgi:hypothetical protein
MSEQGTTKDQLWSSSFGKLTQAILGALFLGWLVDASRAEIMLMFMVLHLHLDVYYG